MSRLKIINNKIFMEIENKTQNNMPTKKSGKKKFIVIGIALLVVAGVGSYFLPGGFNIWSKLNILMSKNTAAIINSEKITKSDLDFRIEQAKQVIQRQGADLTDEKVVSAIEKQILSDMVNEKILLQSTAESGITVSDDEILAAYNEMVATFKTKEDFEKELTSRNITEKIIKENIADQITLNKYINQNIDIKNISVTSEEINSLYKYYSSQQENMPKIEEIKSQLENEVKQQKTKAMVLELIEKLKKDANIKILL